MATATQTQSIALARRHQRNIELDFEKKGAVQHFLLLYFLEEFIERRFMCWLLMCVAYLLLVAQLLF
jgi:hypothetical protein